MLSGLMLTWLLPTLLVTMVIAWFWKQCSVNDSTRSTWLVAILVGRIETQRNADAVAASVGEHLAMLLDAKGRAQKSKRCTRAIEETRAFIAEASEAGLDQPQRSMRSSSVTSSRRRGRARRRTARGPPSVVGENGRGRNDNP
jgi:hypothetical protein